MNLNIHPTKRFDLTIRYTDPDTKERTSKAMPNISHADLIATLTIHQVPMLTAFQDRGFAQMSGGPQLSWKPVEVQS